MQIQDWVAGHKATYCQEISKIFYDVITLGINGAIQENTYSVDSKPGISDLCSPIYNKK